MSLLETLTVPFVWLYDCRKPSGPADGLVERAKGAWRGQGGGAAIGMFHV